MRSARNVPRMAVGLLMLCLAGGCEAARKGARMSASANNMKQLHKAMVQYGEANGGAWPDRLEDLDPYVEDLAATLQNPLTGERIGYEYVKPSASDKMDQRIVLFQLNGGRRDSELRVTFADGVVRKTTKTEVSKADSLQASGAKASRAQPAPSRSVASRTPVKRTPAPRVSTPKSPTPQNPAPESSPVKPAVSPTAVTSTPPVSSVPLDANSYKKPEGRVIDLIELVRLPQHGFPAQKWKREGDRLECIRGSSVPKVVFPYEPPEEYDVEFVFTQAKLRHPLGVIAPNPQIDKAFVWLVGGEHSGMYMGDEFKGLGPQNLIQQGQTHTAVFSLRRDRLKTYFDGRLTFEVPSSELGAFKVNVWWQNPKPARLAIACDDPTVFSSVKVIEVSGAGRLVDE